jgi:hypothetical protein
MWNGPTAAQIPEGLAEAEIFAELPESVGNITFTPGNRVIFSHHPFFGHSVRVAELNSDRKSYRPFLTRNGIRNARALTAISTMS